jgi:CRISPR-associated exonuclease Cas4
MFPDDQLLPISALQHLLYCPRQCALIHVERLWAENRFTVEGRHLHGRADAGKRENRGGLRTTRALPLWSYQLGLIGKADVVEFRGPEPVGGTRPEPARGEPVESVEGQAASSSLSSQNSALSTGTGVPYPVEYKRGKPKPHEADRVQLCAQALCLEEMFGVAVPAGALFYGKTRRRCDVSFDATLRALTRDTITRAHELLESGVTPPAVYEKKKCESCSLIDLCLPRAPAGRAKRYFDRALADAVSSAGPASD